MSVIKAERLGEERLNYQDCLMKIVQYNNAQDVVVEFQDGYKITINTSYDNFYKGKVKNPYSPSVYNIGMIGAKYPSKENGVMTKEYTTWRNMLTRCFDDNYKRGHLAYQDAICCDEWLLFENFYEWLHSQKNFEKWLNGENWCIDKDILIKGNKVYSPTTCCLVPHNVNLLFVKKGKGTLPIGVYKNGNGYAARCDNSLIGKTERLGTYRTAEQAFLVYKIYKENLIKKVAEIEYLNGNIDKLCYESMVSYIVEIDD